VALVGEKMSGQVGVSGKMMSALGSNGVSIRYRSRFFRKKYIGGD